MVTSPQDHWMIKERILKFEGKREDKTKFGPIRKECGRFFEKTNKMSKRGGVSQPKVSNQRRERREKNRWEVSGGVEGETVNRCIVGL